MEHPAERQDSRSIYPGGLFIRGFVKTSAFGMGHITLNGWFGMGCRDFQYSS